MRKILVSVMFIISSFITLNLYASDNEIENTYKLAKERLDTGVNKFANVEYKRINNYIVISEGVIRVAIIESENRNGYMSIYGKKINLPFFVFSGKFMGKGEDKGNKIEIYLESLSNKIDLSHIYSDYIFIEEDNATFVSDYDLLQQRMHQGLGEVLRDSASTPKPLKLADGAVHEFEKKEWRLIVKITPHGGKSVEQAYNIDGFDEVLKVVCPSF